MSRIVAWTGHRPDLFRDAGAARAAVEAEARAQRAGGATVFLVGGQRGVDTWAALSALDLAVPFRVILPFDVDEFTRDWLQADRSVLRATLDRAAAVCVAGGYDLRNRRLATEAQLVVAVWTATRGGGTAETIDFARQAGTPVREILLDPSSSAASMRGRGI